ncbi:MAG: DUF3530 family protein [Gammaproteobacteria bacterium]|nr:DUF3530 family protein [Gammaproteobacteria bacterium]
MNISAINALFQSKFKFFLLFFGLISLVFSKVFALNIESEKRWAEQLRDNIVIGEPIDLPLVGIKADSAASQGSENAFLGIYTPHSTDMPKGAIILMHGTGAHPDWGDVIHPLRAELPDKGWATLSIQLPLTLPEKKDEESLKKVIDASVPRIEAAINYLNANTYSRIILISHSFGSLMALNFLELKAQAANKDNSPIIAAAIIIGTPSSGTTTPFNSPKMIEKINIPLLDLYGSNDLDKVIRTAKARKTAAKKAKNTQYRQSKTIGADHFYNGLNDELTSYVSNWLKKIFYP